MVKMFERYKLVVVIIISIGGSEGCVDMGKARWLSQYVRSRRYQGRVGRSCSHGAKDIHIRSPPPFACDTWDLGS